MKKLELGSCVYKVDDNGKMRAYFVISNPQGDPPKIIAVSITDYETHFDKSVVLEAENPEHPAIKKKSVVAYIFTQDWEVEKIEAELNNNEERTDLHHSDPVCSIELVKKLRKGLLNSRAVKKKYRTMLMNDSN